MDFVFQRTYRGPLQAAIFDWAGTTVDYGCFAPAVVFIEVFKNHGVEINMEQARGPMGAAKREHIKMISQMEPVAEAWRAKHGSECSEADIDTMYQEFIPLQLKCILDYNELVPGVIDTMRDIRGRRMKIGSTTGYNREMMELVAGDAKKHGYSPDADTCASDVPAGRPEPWMCLKIAQELRVYPMEAVVKIGDTVPDIDEGLNANMWTVGVVMSGNEMGLRPAEVNFGDDKTLNKKREKAYLKLAQAGAHYVIDSVIDLPAVLDDINARLARGERP
ncbi:MAG: phosphonoacetaldehyde hydrolase [bacterium]|nr:phosphonoacetaldehyde hydrolase [bacterium]